jgi:hypothetical protein
MDFTISRILSSGITPGPLGILDTSPRAVAPKAIAVFCFFDAADTAYFYFSFFHALI